MVRIALIKPILKQQAAPQIHEVLLAGQSRAYFLNVLVLNSLGILNSSFYTGVFMSFSVKINTASQTNVRTCTYFFYELKTLTTDVVNLFNKIKPLLIDLSLNSSQSLDQVLQRKKALEERQKSPLITENNNHLKRSKDLDKDLSDSRDLTTDQQTVLKEWVQRASDANAEIISSYKKGEALNPPEVDDLELVFREKEKSLASTQITNKRFAKAICDGFTVLRQQIDDIARKPFRQTPFDKYQSIFEDITKLEAKSATLNEATQGSKDLTMAQKDLFEQQHKEICAIAIKTNKEMNKNITESGVPVPLSESRVFVTLKLDFSKDQTIDQQIKKLLAQEESNTQVNRMRADLKDIKNSNNASEEDRREAKELEDDIAAIYGITGDIKEMEKQQGASEFLNLGKKERAEVRDLKGGVIPSSNAPAAAGHSANEPSPLNPPPARREPRNAERRCDCSLV